MHKIEKKEGYLKFHHLAMVPIILLLLLGWNATPPVGIEVQGWRIMIAFIATILFIMLNVMPMGATAFVALSLCIVTKLLTLEEALEGFSSNIVWLVVLAFFISRSIIKTGLGKRIAYWLISKFGKNTLGLSYSLIFTELLLAPVIPSASARGGGIIYPVMQSLIEQFHNLSETGEENNGNAHPHKKNTAAGGKLDSAIGSFFTMICFHANVITSSMFITAMAANPIAVKFAAYHGIEISWYRWMLGAIVPGIAILLLLPLVVYVLYKPKISNHRQIMRNIRVSLASLGKFSLQESITSVIFFALLSMWALEAQLNIKATTVAMLGFSAMLIFKTLKWDDVLNEKGAFETLSWFAILLTMANALNKAGIITWISGKIPIIFANSSYIATIAAILLFVFYIHYFFASITVHITVLYSTSLSILLSLGAPALPSALSLAILSTLSGGLTHYGTSSAPIFFGSGNMSVANWWRSSFIVSSCSLVIWVIVSALWWRLLGWL